MAQPLDPMALFQGYQGADVQNALRQQAMRQSAEMHPLQVRQLQENMLLKRAEMQQNQMRQQQQAQYQNNVLQSRERMASERLNALANRGKAPPKPQWDSARGVWITPPTAGGLGAAPGQGGIVRPQGLPPSRDEIKAQEKDREMLKTVNLYETARDGLIGALENTVTGPIAGRIPAITEEQQTAEGGVAAMAPVLKQLFRVSGEGVFTDRDQQLLLDMVPKRTDLPEARRKKMENIDGIVSAKLGRPVRRFSAAKTGPQAGGASGGWSIQEVK